MSIETEAKTVANLKGIEVAILAAAVINTAGRAFSLKEVLELHRDLSFSLDPRPGLGSYEEWLKTKDATLAKTRN